MVVEAWSHVVAVQVLMAIPDPEVLEPCASPPSKVIIQQQ